MKDHHQIDPGESRGHNRHQRGGEHSRARRAPIEQERPIRITAEQVQRSLRDTERARSRRKFRNYRRARPEPAPPDAHDGRRVAFRDRFWPSVLLALPTLVWGHMLPGVLGYSPPAVVGAQWIPAVSGTAVFAYGGWPFLSAALRELRSRRPGMMTLIVLAISVTFTFSVAVELGFSGSALWEELATLVVVLLVGQWIARRSITQVDAPTTGLTNEPQHAHSRAQTKADRAGSLLTIVVIATGIVTLVSWLVVRPADVSFAVERLVTVLVIASPHAFGLAVQLVTGISRTVGARSGLIIRNLDKTRGLTTVVFDKAGTLTLGEYRVVDIATIEGLEADDALRLAAAVERDSPHPIAHAIRASAMERGLHIPTATDFRSIAGHGVMAAFDGREFAVGGPNLLQELNADPDHALAAEEISASARGHRLIYLIEDTRVIAAFAVEDAIRPESLDAVRRLRRLGIEVTMMTSDSSTVARSIAKQLGIQRVLSQVRPEDKARRVEELRTMGKRVAMVAGGVDEAQALAAADVGVAFGAGTEVAVKAGDVIVVRDDPRDVPRALKLARASYRTITQNSGWIAAYNAVAIPLAAGVLAFRGILPSPVVGAVLVSASTIVVAINAQLLRRVKL